MGGPSHPAGSGTKHVGARLTPTESPQNRVGALGQNTRVLVQKMIGPPWRAALDYRALYERTMLDFLNF